MEGILLENYPMTGLGRIVSIPFTIFLSLFIASIQDDILKKISTTSWKSVGIIALFCLLTILMTIIFWTQDGGPSTWEQIFEGQKREVIK